VPSTLQAVSAIADLRAVIASWRAQRLSIGLVPTMGALHDGHVALIQEAQRRCDLAVVSIFVNPLQFNASNDFERYPRQFDDDIAMCERVDVRAVYTPTAEVMYPKGWQTRVVPGALADVMEGEMRPGHFEGVTTVVAKLFGAVRPHVAIFGQKDFQQVAIVTRMNRDLDLGVEIVGHPTIREPDGLAMSSRNLRLTSDQRLAAVCVPRALAAAVECATRDGATTQEVCDAARRVVEHEPLARHEYTTVFDTDTLRETDDLHAHPRQPGTLRVGQRCGSATYG
jgi:pantoate--beta-alanine ligase